MYNFDWKIETISIQCYYWRVCSISYHFVDFVMFVSFLILICYSTHQVGFILSCIFLDIVIFLFCMWELSIFGSDDLVVMNSFSLDYYKSFFISPSIMKNSFAG
jgi:hypothetical protein